MSSQQLEFYSSIVVLTGAGLSARSGVPTLQDPNLEAALSLHNLSRQSQPNECHLALAEWEKRVLERSGHFTLLTHNCDGLHQRAGSQNVVELYGSIHRLRCSAECDWQEETNWKLPLPPCPRCSKPSIPDVAWFRETPAAEAEWLAQRALRRCDLLLALAVSHQTPRLLDFAHLARFAKARTVLVSLDPSNQLAEEFDEIHEATAEDFVQEIWSNAQAVKEPTRLRPLSVEEVPEPAGQPADLTPLERTVTSGYLALFDIADFKTRNHLLGHAQGDQDLEDFLQVAEAVGVQACMRYSQDQFVVICPRLETLEALQVTFSHEQPIESGYRALACKEGCLRSKIVMHNLSIRRALRVAYVMVFRGQALAEVAAQTASKVKFVAVDQILPVNEVGSKHQPWSALQGEFSALQCPFCHGGEFEWDSQDVASLGRQGKCLQCTSDVEFENFSRCS